MTYIVVFDDNDQFFEETGAMIQNFVTLYGPLANDPVWAVYFNRGNDLFYGPQAIDIYIGGISLIVFGGEGSDSIGGSYHNDTVDGGAGDDIMYDSIGDDTYVVDSIDDLIVDIGYSALFARPGSSGVDTVLSSVEYVLPSIMENLVLTGNLEINGFGNVGRNSITGNAAANVIDGGLGIDTMRGGAGDDVYIVESTNDLVIELAGQGVDIVEAWVSYVLPTFVEQGFIASAGRSHSLTGNALGNLLVGNAGNNRLLGLDGKDELRGEGGNDTLLGGAGIDTLDGGSGADVMEGGIGNDIYYVDNGLDLVIEAVDGGYDTLFTSTAVVLPDNVEKLVFNGLSDGTILSGNDLANFLVGNYTDDLIDVGSGSDSAAGGSGDDTLLGGSGNDTLLGEFGIDSIVGGLGRDILIGGAGADLFVFIAVTDSEGFNRDLIKDFEDGIDRIDLRRIDAGNLAGDQAFAFVGTEAFTAAGQVRVITSSNRTQVEVSLDSDPDAEMLILLNGVHNLTSADFIL